jgi:hypothetical protein
VFKFGHEHLLTVLQSAEVMDIGHGADPVARRRIWRIDRPRARLVPTKASIRCATDTVLDVVLVRSLRRMPGLLRRLSIIWVDSIHPTEPQPLLEAQSRKVDPLRTSPCAIAIGERAKDELRNAGCEQTETLLILAQPLL